MFGKLVQLASRCNGLDGKLQTLESKIEELSSRETDINDELKVAELQKPGKKRKKEVENWLRNVSSKKNEVQSIKQEARENLLLSYLLSRGDRIDKLIGEIGELHEQGAFPRGLLLDMPETKGEPLLTTKLIGQAFEQNVKEILAHLMDDEVMCIGIYGMGGAGKTTLALHVHNRLLEKYENFDRVYWFTVSQENSVGKLQNDIAKTLHLDFSKGDDERKRAAELSRALTKREKCVLILDDVWNPIHLKRVGIPIRVNGCKVILTTRSLDICYRMECQAKISVKPLLEDEAWNLFMESLGQPSILSREVIDIAISMATECAGLPLGVITMAASMRGVDDISEWRSVLKELKELTMGHADMEKDVFPILKLSYSRLNDTKLQLCFLYCALYPEDFQIKRSELIRYLNAEELIGKRHSWKAKSDLVHTMLNKLERSCLLESCEDYEGNRCVKMHDLIRDMALKITEAGHPRFMVKASVGLNAIPDEQEWTEDLDKVSLMDNQIIEIPEGLSPKCPRLSTMIMSWNSLNRIAYSFFVHMHALQLLDLSKNHFIVELPNSISDLENLTALLLGGCESLEYVPPLGKLMALQELDLSFTAIKNVPQGVAGLVSLKRLNMEWTRNLQMIPSGTLSRLSHLQQLRLHCEAGPVQVQTKELEGITNLEEFEVRLYDVHGFNRIIKSLQQRNGARLNNYTFVLRHSKFERVDEDDYYYFFSKSVRLEQCIFKRGGEGEEGVILLPYDLQFLEIVDCHFANSSSCLCDIIPSLGGNVRDLKLCIIRFCSGIDYISSFCGVPFQRFESLVLKHMRDLSSVFKMGMGVPSPAGTFSMLKELRICDCPKIKTLFGYEGNDNDMEWDPVDLSLSGDCSFTTLLVKQEKWERQRSRINDNQHHPITLPKLTNLYLEHLPRLESIYDGMLICNAIEIIHVKKCPNLKRLPFLLPLVKGQPSAPKALREIEIVREQWQSLEWDHPYAKDILLPFVRFPLVTVEPSIPFPSLNRLWTAEECQLISQEQFF